MTNDKIIIGRKDMADLTDLRLLNIPVKIDTGAYTSSLHCDLVKVFIENGEKKLSFHIVDLPQIEDEAITFVTSDFKLKKVKSSSGHIALRYIIKTNIELFGIKYLTEFSLSDRNTMKFPVLIGRKLLRKIFLVDVSKVNLSFKKKHSRKKE